MVDGLTPNEAAERLGVPPTTLVTWLAELPIPGAPREGEPPRLGEEALAVLEAVRGMRAYDLGFQTIRRHLEALEDVDDAEAEDDPAAAAVARAAQAAIRAAAVEAAGPVEAVGASPAEAAEEPAEAAVGPAPAAVPTSVTFVGPDASEIAEAVTRALAPVIAQLAELAGAQGRELNTQARLIGQFEADNAFVRRDRDRLAAELVEARARIAWLEGRLDARAAKPWWRFWG